MIILKNMFSRRWILATLFVLVGSAVCVRLGIWQLDRLSQRLAFNEQYLLASNTTPLMLNSAPMDDLTTMEYRIITVTGTYDPLNQVVLRNQFHDNQPGYFLLTPLILSDGVRILIERGWIPAAGNSTPTDWHQYDLPDQVTISGIIRLGPSQPELGGVRDPELTAGQLRLDFWNNINLDRIGKQMPGRLLSVFVQPNPEPIPTEPPYPYQPTIEISEGPHFGYAMQWFSFALLLFFGYPFFLRQQMKNT